MKINIKTIIIGFVIIIVTSMLIFNQKSWAQSGEGGKLYNAYRTVDGEGFSQIVYESEGLIKVITKDKWPHADPVANNKIIVWSAQVGSLWQLYYYDVMSEQTVQLTRAGNNVNPQFSGDILVWEGQRSGVWHILMFDGVRITQLSNGDFPSQNPVIEDGYVVYEQKNAQDEWQIYLFDKQKERTFSLTPQSFGRTPHIEGGVVTWQDQDQESGETTYFTYEIDSQDTFFEGTKSGRKKLKEDLVEKVKIIKKKITKPGFIPYTIQSDTEEVTQVDIEDIKEELGLDFNGLAPGQVPEGDTEVIEKPVVKESTESVDTAESTSSGQ